jgi:hypothetical protein
VCFNSGPWNTFCFKRVHSPIGHAILTTAFFAAYGATALATCLHYARPESWMSFSARFPTTSLYRVEVSGWDKSQTFFVEKSELQWNEESGKHVTQISAVPDGSVVFLRLIQSLSADRSQSVPYETEFVSVTPGGHNQFRLHPVSPRAAERGSVN